MNGELSRRKHPRLAGYDYSSNGVYFVTVCVKERRKILCTISVGRDAHIPPRVELTPIGTVLDKYIRNIDTVYENVSVEKYVIMPNHFHLLIKIDSPTDENGGMRASRPTLYTVIRSLKTMVTREVGQSLFQTSYYDHIIRDEADFLTRRKYIDENPAKWESDDLFQK